MDEEAQAGPSKTRRKITKRKGKHPLQKPTPVKKKRKAEYQATYNKQRVYIGDEVDRWKTTRVAMNMNDRQFAKYLLDLHSRKIQSTPIKTGTGLPAFIASDSDPPSDIQPMSGTEPMVSDQETVQKPSTTQASAVEDDSPDNFSINVTFPELEEVQMEEEEDAEEEERDPDDPTWDPNISLEPKDYEAVQQLPMWCIEEEIFNIAEKDHGPPPKDDELFMRVQNAEELDEERLFLTFECSLRDLFHKLLPPCHCQKAYTVDFKSSGTGMYAVWKCEDGHIGGKWCSQPKLNRGMLAGDLLWSASVLFSGSSFEKVRLMFNFLNCGSVTQPAYAAMQREYLIPTVDSAFVKMQHEILHRVSGQELIISGDGRMDSPGFSAEYCTYITMDHETKDVLSMLVINKRQVENKSPLMEKEGLLKSLKFLRDNGVIIKEVITDAHMSIAAHFRKNEPGVKHSWDVWHGAKNIGKKIVAAGRLKQTKSLLGWSADICKHFWDCARTCDGSQARFLAKWKGVIHHVLNEHNWLFGEGMGAGECEHGPLVENPERPNQWLQPRTPAFRALKEVVLNTRLLDNTIYYVNYRHTGVIESINAHLLMYCPKRVSYRPPAYKARNQLALMDYQMHKDLPVRKTAGGSECYGRRWSKASQAWTVAPRKVAKHYSYIKEMKREVVRMRLESRVSMYHRVELDRDDPRQIRPTLAPTAPPPTAELVRSHQSRFQNK